MALSSNETLGAKKKTRREQNYFRFKGKQLIWRGLGGSSSQNRCLLLWRQHWAQFFLPTKFLLSSHLNSPTSLLSSQEAFSYIAQGCSVTLHHPLLKLMVSPDFFPVNAGSGNGLEVLSNWLTLLGAWNVSGMVKFTNCSPSASCHWLAGVSYILEIVTCGNGAFT